MLHRLLTGVPQAMTHTLNGDVPPAAPPAAQTDLIDLMECFNRGAPSVPLGAVPRRAHVLHPMDVRIYFVLHCASRSCPPIRVYEPARLAAQLELATRAFVDAETQVDPAARTLAVLVLFKWYRDDFAAAGGVVPFVSRHLDEADPRRVWLQEHGTPCPPALSQV